MVNLNCDVCSCIHNSDHCCCKSAILVDGSEAKDKGCTCCASFDERKGDSFHNSFAAPKDALAVDCSASNCVYNENRICNADHIDIGGTHAKDSEETLCATFRMR